MPSPPALPVAILAGGLATRLRPITEKVPKVLVPVAGRPFLAHQLDLLRKQGITRIVLCLGHLGEKVVEDFGDGSAHGVHLDDSFDSPRLLGTGGALKQAAATAEPKPKVTFPLRSTAEFWRDLNGNFQSDGAEQPEAVNLMAASTL